MLGEFGKSLKLIANEAKDRGVAFTDATISKINDSETLKNVWDATIKNEGPMKVSKLKIMRAVLAAADKIGTNLDYFIKTIPKINLNDDFLAPLSRKLIIKIYSFYPNEVLPTAISHAFTQEEAVEAIQSRELSDTALNVALTTFEKKFGFDEELVELHEKNFIKTGIIVSPGFARFATSTQALNALVLAASVEVLENENLTEVILRDNLVHVTWRKLPEYMEKIKATDRFSHFVPFIDTLSDFLLAGEAPEELVSRLAVTEGDGIELLTAAQVRSTELAILRHDKNYSVHTSRIAELEGNRERSESESTELLKLHKDLEDLKTFILAQKYVDKLKVA